MVTLNRLDLDLAVVLGAIVVTALLSRKTQLPITALEIVAGILLVAILGFTLPSGTDSILTLGSLLIVFLAGLETNFGFLRANLGKALAIGLTGFAVPAAGLFLLFDYGLHAPLFISVVGATVLADTSISITYTTLHQYGLADLPFGRLVLAATLCVNLAEDTTITTATFLTASGVLFTLGILAALGVSAVFLPKLSKAVQERGATHFGNVRARSLLFSLAVLALLSALVGVPGVLFVFLMGLVFSRFVGPDFLANIRSIAFALFVPLYFVGVGLRVDAGFVLSHWPVLLILAGVASLVKVGALLPLTRRYFGVDRAMPVAVLMNARLTSATVILTLTLGLGLITVGWYSLLISVVVILALGSATALRGFPAFASPSAAREAFGSDVAGSPAGAGAARSPAVAAGGTDASS